MNFSISSKFAAARLKFAAILSYPGCIYSEMKMCLAPCFAGCSKDEYDAEVARVLVTLSTSGSALTDELGREREAASAALDFERAAALHKKIEKAGTVLKGFPELARRLDELDAVILQKSAEENAIAVFVVRAGIISRSVSASFCRTFQPAALRGRNPARAIGAASRNRIQSSNPPATRKNKTRLPRFARIPESSASILRCSLDGFIPSLARAKSFFARAIGPTAASFALVRAY